MSIVAEDRIPESPYLEAVTWGHTESEGSVVRPAESHWHLVLVKYRGQLRAIVVGPWTSAGVTAWGEGAEILWLKFQLGTFMPQLPAKGFLDHETPLPGASSRSFWLQGSAWEAPDPDHVDVFIDRLVRRELLLRDPVVGAVLQNQPSALAPRTVRHRFLQATGLSQSHILQIGRAQRAAQLLRAGVSVADTVAEVGYFDQPHLTRSLKRFIGHTPLQLLHSRGPQPLTKP